MTKPRTGAGKAPAPKRRGGVSKSADERRSMGLELLQGIWIDAKLYARIDAECERRGLRRAALVRIALQEWLDSAK